MAQNKNHWYDGWFYDSIIAPNQDQLFKQLISIIDSQSTIIDVGCGTGRLAFALADNCKSVLGIDLSKRNINRANLILQKRPSNKILFHHGNVSEIKHENQFHFNYAVITYVIHEVDEDERIKLLIEIAQIADKVIIGDYIAPKPSGFEGKLSKAIEFLAGREHYKNYKSYMANGGIHYLANKAELKVIAEINGVSATNQIVVLSK